MSDNNLRSVLSKMKARLLALTGAEQSANERDVPQKAERPHTNPNSDSLFERSRNYRAVGDDDIRGMASTIRRDLGEEFPGYSDEELIVRVLLAKFTQPDGSDYLPLFRQGERPIEVTQHDGGYNDTFVLISAVGTPTKATILVHFSGGRVSRALTIFRNNCELEVTRELEVFVEAIRRVKVSGIEKNGSRVSNHAQDFCY